MALKLKKSSREHIRSKEVLKEIRKEEQKGTFARLDFSVHEKLESILYQEKISYRQWLTNAINQY